MRIYFKWVATLSCLVPLIATAAQEARVFPVKAVFFDDKADSKIDPLFREYIKSASIEAISSEIHSGLSQAFSSRLGKINPTTAGNTFAVSFHLTRANSFVVDKSNGNSDVIAAITGSIYFTNVVSSEILTTVSRTVVSRSVVANSSNLPNERKKLFQQSLNTLKQELIEQAPKQFQPVIIEARITDRNGELLVLDAGYRQGLAVGDNLEDSARNLLSVVYAAENYAVAKPILASNLNIGAVFQKFSAHPATGRDRPTVAVMVEKLPDGYAKDYIARLFSELLGDAASLSVVQINTGFTQLLSTIVQNGAEINSMESAGRVPPTLIIRLRIPETIYFETGTNLDFEKMRRYETRAFADVIDSSGRIVFSTAGSDVIQDKIIRGVGAGFEERKEVGIKNALSDLSKKLAQIGQLSRDRTDVIAITEGGSQINSIGRVYGEKQPGVLLRKAKIKFGNEIKEILLPVYEANVEGFSGQSITKLEHKLPIDTTNNKIAIGDQFEVQRLGTTPKSSAKFSVCGPAEHLGNTQTPYLIETTGLLFGQKMPGMMYVTDAMQLTEGVIGVSSGFRSGYPWTLPPVANCVQPVDRINIGPDSCGQQCDRPIVSRYTLRVKKGADILSRIGFESQFRSSGFYPKTTSAQNIDKLLSADVLDEASGLMGKAIEQIKLPLQ